MRERFERRAAQVATHAEHTDDGGVHSGDGQDAPEQSSVDQLSTMASQMTIMVARLERLETTINSFDMRLSPGQSVIEQKISNLGQTVTILGAISMLLLVTSIALTAIL